jgi:hypothetical protein
MPNAEVYHSFSYWVFHHTPQRQLYTSKVLMDKGTINVCNKRNVIFVMQVGGEEIYKSSPSLSYIPYFLEMR